MAAMRGRLPRAIKNTSLYRLAIVGTSGDTTILSWGIVGERIRKGQSTADR